MKYEIVITETAHKDLRRLPTNIADGIDRKIRALAIGLPGSVRKLHGIDFGYRLRLADHRILFDLEGTPLRSSVFFTVDMRTLHQAKGRKNARVSTKAKKQRQSRTTALKMMEASTRLQVRIVRAQFEKLRQAFEDFVDAHDLALARLENAGKDHMTLNESREKRGLPPL